MSSKNRVDATVPVAVSKAARDPDLDAIYAEGDSIIWLRVDLYRTARLAKRVAWSGEGIPHGFREDGDKLKDLKVSRVWMRCDGEKNGYDQWWTQVSVTDVADLTEFFRVEPALDTRDCPQSRPSVACSDDSGVDGG